MRIKIKVEIEGIGCSLTLIVKEEALPTWFLKPNEAKIRYAYILLQTRPAWVSLQLLSFLKVVTYVHTINPLTSSPTPLFVSFKGNHALTFPKQKLNLLLSKTHWNDMIYIAEINFILYIFFIENCTCHYIIGFDVTH
jgi:hypothetical protein